MRLMLDDNNCKHPNFFPPKYITIKEYQSLHPEIIIPITPESSDSIKVRECTNCGFLEIIPINKPRSLNEPYWYQTLRNKPKTRYKKKEEKYCSRCNIPHPKSARKCRNCGNIL